MALTGSRAQAAKTISIKIKAYMLRKKGGVANC